MINSGVELTMENIGRKMQKTIQQFLVVVQIYDDGKGKRNMRIRRKIAKI